MKLKKIISIGIIYLYNQNSAYAEVITQEYIQSELSGANSYNEKCYTNFKYQELTNIPFECSSYFFIDISEADESQRKNYTSNLIGIGFNKPYILIKNPHRNSIITSYNKFSSKSIIDEINRLIPLSLTRKESRDARNATATKIIREEVYLDKTVSFNHTQKAIFEYKLEFFSRHPFFKNEEHFLDNKKFVRVSLDNSPGISFNAIGDQERSWVVPTWANYQYRYYSYPDYLDQVSITTQLDGDGIELYDHIPKNTDKDNSSFTKESTVEIDVGLNIPHLPVESISYKNTQTMTYDNGQYMNFDVSNNKNVFEINYKNKWYGSDISAGEGYCRLIKNYSNSYCWNWATSKDDSPFDFQKLKGTPYSNEFIPKFSATYSSPYNNNTTSDLSIKATIQGLNILGYRKWYIGQTWHHGSLPSYNPSKKPFNLNQYDMETKFTINWDSPIFLGTQPVMLRSVKRSDQKSHCLTVTDSNIVRSDVCQNGNKDQYFFYMPDNYEYIYARNKNKCLTTQEDNLIVTECSESLNNNNVVWRWKEKEGRLYLYTHNKNGFKVLSPSDDNSHIKVVSIKSLKDLSPDTAFSTISGSLSALF
ncbi:hypothetical protein CTM97_06225 [Photobacterium phosphoreum]|uniref:Uncharacterized protein n=1 Tax=Photobacterium phosphoreum TaxID=659 RepID=A0A2T3JTI8_PHOPO|nr:hypothetical protein [Photobacterium phosphoreum]PSU25864.1 hypothetical protein CTM96_07050 [Photobacterium phosphoreum]PSU43228.1 hypothetical protein CTM97_06225 [Photobacterium phosphoreum]PSU52507.1 hypothetical protein C9J18_08110 [Photobacterium phosphoreum]